MSSFLNPADDFLSGSVVGVLERIPWRPGEVFRLAQTDLVDGGYAGSLVGEVSLGAATT